MFVNTRKAFMAIRDSFMVIRVQIRQKKGCVFVDVIATLRVSKLKIHKVISRDTEETE